MLLIKWVACLPQPYPYAVYYCHFIETAIKVFKVSLGAENGDNKIETLGVCHLDTSDWNPNHIIFTRLGIKPGKAPVCHFFPVNLSSDDYVPFVELSFYTELIEQYREETVMNLLKAQSTVSVAGGGQGSNNS
ncbi:BURP domain-containing protein 17 [Glycine soja]|uniref:BURP domain-containing protein 17 n=1 Tax=Glycine soja TaxID=3848 RepID=A0A0B2Q4D5_GLYSO|nr:hypothetical protein JHK87_030663 [Glycine soja]KHN14853.1 BURP domain-containing protein 17 [Glycine soja]